MIRIALADDETLIRRGLRTLLELTSDFAVVLEASDGHELLAARPQTACDVVLLDVRMPQLDGLQTLDRLRCAPPMVPTIILTTFDNPELLLAAAQREARGFLPKAVSLEELSAAIRAVAAGATWFQPAVTSTLRRALTGRHAATVGCEALTEQEKAVLKLVAGGLTNREIAHTFGVADGTVKNQVASVLAKLGVHDRTLAVLRAIEAGVI
jgi:DNA-binding NarL/FixJ family response regulator